MESFGSVIFLKHKSNIIAFMLLIHYICNFIALLISVNYIKTDKQMQQNMTKKIKYLVLGFITCAAVVSCNKDDNPVPPEPSIENVEIGTGNNGEGVIGRDFHFDMDVVAGDLIETVQVRIQQRNDETYSQEWEFEITWGEFQGLKNTNVHKHFDIPEDAPEGNYNFIIVVNDRNGSALEETKAVKLIDPANLPVNPELYLWSIGNSNGDSYYVNGRLENPEHVRFAKSDVLNSNIQIRKVKDDGVMYLLLVKKGLNHLPETVVDIDFSKAIVFDVYQHSDEEEVFTFWNTPYNSELQDYERWPELTIGATNDNNAPGPNPINGNKAWENGEYYFGVVYTNTTHNLSMHHYMEVTIEGF